MIQTTHALARLRSPTLDWERLLAFVAAVATAALASLLLPAGWPAAALALAAVGIAVWHGAFDGVLAQNLLQPEWGARWWPLFSAAYLALAAVVMVLWWLAPAAALVCFLGYSALHFGTEGEARLSPTRVLLGAATGLVPIAAACHWWPHVVSGIFAQMLQSDAPTAAPMTATLGRMLWPAAALALAAGWPSRRRLLLSTALITAELVLFQRCSPLVAFAIFFCLWHTPEHLLSTSLNETGHFERQRLHQHLRQGLLPWLLSLSALVLACWFGPHTTEAYTGRLFIFLSALTVPHMLLAELLRHQQHHHHATQKPLWHTPTPGSRRIP